MKDEAISTILGIDLERVRDFGFKEKKLLKEFFAVNNGDDNVYAFENRGYKMSTSPPTEERVFLSLLERLTYAGEEAFDGYVEDEVIANIARSAHFDDEFIDDNFEELLEEAREYRETETRN